MDPVPQLWPNYVWYTCIDDDWGVPQVSITMVELL